MSVQIGKASRGKFGLVTLWNKDGVLLRQWKISGDELAQLHSGSISHPPGCTIEEWKENRGTCDGKDFYVGDVLTRVQLKVGEYTDENGMLHERMVFLDWDDWDSGSDVTKLTVTQSAIDEINAVGPEIQVKSIIDGVIEYM